MSSIAAPQSGACPISESTACLLHAEECEDCARAFAKLVTREPTLVRQQVVETRLLERLAEQQAEQTNAFKGVLKQLEKLTQTLEAVENRVNGLGHALEYIRSTM